MTRSPARNSTCLPTRFLTCLLLAGPTSTPAQSQATLTPDGKARYALGAGASLASGNTSASSVNLSGDAVRALPDSKWQFGGKANWGRSDGAKTVENLSLVTEHDQDLTPRWFSFGKGDYLRDKPANLRSRGSLFGGLGLHLLRSDTLGVDLTAGLGYTEDRYFEAADVEGVSRSRYGRAEGLLAEESTHQWTPSTRLHQKLSLFPALRSGGGYRGVFDAGLAVAMTDTLSLTAALTYRYNSDPGQGLRRSDTLFMTGIAVKLD